MQKTADHPTSNAYSMRGGANLRFFHSSPRYSEDMDLDVLGGAVSTLRKNGYRILSDAAFRRSRAALGVGSPDSRSLGRQRLSNVCIRRQSRPGVFDS